MWINIGRVKISSAIIFRNLIAFIYRKPTNTSINHIKLHNCQPKAEHIYVNIFLGIYFKFNLDHNPSITINYISIYDVSMLCDRDLDL